MFNIFKKVGKLDGTRIGRYGKNKSLVRYLYATGDGHCTGIKISASEYNIKRIK